MSKTHVQAEDLRNFRAAVVELSVGMEVLLMNRPTGRIRKTINTACVDLMHLGVHASYGWDRKCHALICKIEFSKRALFTFNLVVGRAAKAASLASIKDVQVRHV